MPKPAARSRARRAPDAALELLRDVPDALSRLTEAIQAQQAAPSTGVIKSIPGWVQMLVGIVAAVVAVTLFIASRPTIDSVEKIVSREQEPVKKAIEEQKSALGLAVQEQRSAIKDVGESLKKVGDKLGEVRDSQMRAEEREKMRAPAPVPAHEHEP